MEDQTQSGEECTRYRHAFDECRDEAWADEHKRGCQVCSAWTAQSVQIMDLAADMPQFDVSEALTQRILNAVELERAVAPHRVPLYIWPSAVLLAGLLLTAVPYETMDGLLSWVCGIGALGVVQFLVSTKSGEQAVV